MGFCLFNNVALAALHARSLSVGVQRIAIVDYDVHHGNGTQDCFWNDPDTLFISIHQDNNYPSGTGTLKETGGPDAPGATINIPLPPGTLYTHISIYPYTHILVCIRCSHASLVPYMNHQFNQMVVDTFSTRQTTRNPPTTRLTPHT